MNTRIGLLAGIACVQLLIVAYLLFMQGTDNVEPRQLVAADMTEIHQLDIADGDTELTLQLQEDQWQVDGYPADGDKIKTLLDKLIDLRATWPVANTASAVERFETDEAGFQRRLRLKDGSGSVLAELFTGTSPGFQRVHARASGSNDIYSVELSNYELGVNVDDWLDKAIFALAQAPSAVTVNYTSEEQPTQTLQKVAEGWTINGTPAAIDVASNYANRFTTLRILGLASDEDIASASEVAELAIEAESGQANLVISRLPDEGDYLLRGSRVDGQYRVATYVAEQLLMSDVEFEVTASPDGDVDADADAGANADANANSIVEDALSDDGASN